MEIEGRLQMYARISLTCVPGLYVMYTHMMKQRRKVFGGGRSAGPKVKQS